MRRHDDAPSFDPTPHRASAQLPGELLEKLAKLPDEVQGLRTDVTGLQVSVDDLAARVGPVEDHVAQEQQLQRHREWATAAGWVPPPIHPADPAPTTSPPTQPPAPVTSPGIDPRPRIWESEDGRRVIKWVIAGCIACALAMAGGLSWTDIRGEVTAWVAGPGLEAPAPAPALPDTREPLDDSPPPLDEPAPAPRPTL